LIRERDVVPCLDNWLAREFRLHRIEVAIKAMATAGVSSPGRRRSRAGAHDR
jgi:hypothetical protein